MNRQTNKTFRAARLNRIVAIVALIVGIFGLSIAFAVITRNLVITGVAEIQSPAWDVRFKTQSSLASGGAEITSTKVDDYTISYHVIFTGINQSAVINFSAENNSSTNAKITDITTTGQNDYNLKHIDYELKYADNNNVAIGDDLLAGATRNMKINLNYVATQPEFEADAGSTVGMTVTIQYSQAP